MAPPRKQTDPSRRISVLVFVATTLALLTAGYWYYGKEVELIRQGKQKEIALIGNLKSGEIKRWRKERLDDAARVARGTELIRDAADLLRNPFSSTYRADLQERLQLERMVDEYQHVLLFAPDGHVMASTDIPPTHTGGG